MEMYVCRAAPECYSGNVRVVEGRLCGREVIHSRGSLCSRYGAMYWSKYGL